jgi:glycine/D-amino acid oxidase-like deaminating enzyme|tara:strand:+ start:924 stop:2285 length:1362 start_codon:yes stop_codon:yes gene_type:complete
MSPFQTDVLIIGAGIIGISSAYYIKKFSPSTSVTIVDQFQPMTLTSAQSGENYRNWWPHPVMKRFSERSMELMQEISVETGDLINLTRRGYLLATRKQDISEIVSGIKRTYDEDTSKFIRTHCAENCRSYQPPLTDKWQDAPKGVDILNGYSLIKKHYPNLDSSIQNILHIRQAGMVDSQQMATFMLEKFKAAGGKRVIGKVLDIDKTDSFSVSIEGETQHIISSQVVNAAGPFAKQICEMLGISLPVENILQQKIAFPDTLNAIPRNLPFSIDLDEQIIDWNAEEKSTLEEDPEFSWLAKTMSGSIHCRPEGGEHSNWLKLGWAFNHEPSEATSKPELDHFYPEIVLRGAARLNPLLKNYYNKLPRNLLHYGGFYTTTPENWPLIGATEVEGFYINAAMSGFGTMVACASGELCSQWVLNKKRPSYSQYLSLERYKDQAFMTQLSSLDKGIL